MMARPALALVSACTVALGLVAPCPGAPFGPGVAEAAVARGATLEALVLRSERVVVAVPGERHARWEEVGGARRIVTYTRLTVLVTIVGPDGESKEGAPGELWVRTLGGVVGEIGQRVHGEARLEAGAPHVVFLVALRDGHHGVTEKAQGLFPLRVDGEGAPRLTAPREPPHLLPAHTSTPTAGDELTGRTLDEAAARIRSARRAR